MKAWSLEELALLWRHSNAEVAEITGRSIEEVGDKRLQTNIERNGWDVNDPEREDALPENTLLSTLIRPGLTATPSATALPPITTQP